MTIGALAMTGWNGDLVAKNGNVRIFGLKRGIRVSSFKGKSFNEKRTNVCILHKRWQLYLEKSPLYVIIGPVATR